jgi:hypothetical protein
MSVHGSGSAPSPDRGETDEERADRNLSELLQELRVLSIGVQVLFAFLLSFPLSSRFEKLHSGQKTLYTVSLLSAAVAIVALIGPVAYHRLVFRRHLKFKLVDAANRMALLGLAAIGTAVVTAVWLTMSIVYPGGAAAVIGSILAVLVIAVWVVIPLLRRRRVE